MPAGRPTKYRPEMCEEVLDYGRQGMGRAEIAYHLDICHETLRTYEREHPEFLAATTRARELSRGWWEQQGREGIVKKHFNANAYSLQVRNRFPKHWRDKQHVEQDGPVEIKITRRTVAPSNRITEHVAGGNGSKP